MGWYLRIGRGLRLNPCRPCGCSFELDETFGPGPGLDATHALFVADQRLESEDLAGLVDRVRAGPVEHQHRAVLSSLAWPSRRWVKPMTLAMAMAMPVGNVRTLPPAMDARRPK